MQAVKKKKKRSAFTLLEMAIVIFIISLLVLIILPNISGQKKRAQTVHESAMVNVVQTQLELYENDTGRQANSYADLTKGNYLTSQQAAKAESEHIKITDGRAVQR